jgi:predicted nucleic acid-binding protein
LSLRSATDKEWIDVTTSSRLSARDALHDALVQRRDIGRILTSDAAFGAVPGISRVTDL